MRVASTTKSTTKPRQEKQRTVRQPSTLVRAPLARVTKKPSEGQMDPHRLARLYQGEYARDSQHQCCTLRYWRGQWWRWQENRYRTVEERDFKVELHNSLKAIIDRHRFANADNIAYPVTTGRVNNVHQALAGWLRVDDTKDQPVWLRDGDTRSFLAVENGLLDLPTLLNGDIATMEAPTPDWFSPVRLPVTYDPNVDCPQWKAFLIQVLEDDQERIALLQEWFGYNLVVDTRLQKFLLMLGDGSNGKSVIISTLVNLLGPDNVSHVPLEMFGDRFQLAATLGKLANIVAEVTNVNKVDEGRLKEFTAGDPMTFDRKYLLSVHARPTARVTIATNNLPRIGDTSQGVWRRMMLMPFNVTIPERDQDILLTDKLKAELPGILNWALDGLRRLRQQGHFTNPSVNAESLAEYREESDPAGLFLDYCCVEDPTMRTPTDQLYEDYVIYCQHHGYKPGNERQFGKDLRRKYPRVKRTRLQENGHRQYVYEGLNVGVVYVPQGSVSITGSDDA